MKRNGSHNKNEILLLKKLSDATISVAKTEKDKSNCGIHDFHQHIFHHPSDIITLVYITLAVSQAISLSGQTPKSDRHAELEPNSTSDRCLSDGVCS